MTTRSKDGIFKRKHVVDVSQLSCHALLATKEPKGFKSASKHPGWLAAMREEMAAVQKNNMWELVPHPPSSNVVGSKWGYRTKFNSNGSIDRLKA
ncbi:putative zinc finger, CCHC-type containing protein, partial [Tanacetum coccineum]